MANESPDLLQEALQYASDFLFEAVEYAAQAYPNPQKLEVPTEYDRRKEREAPAKQELERINSMLGDVDLSPFDSIAEAGIE